MEVGSINNFFNNAIESARHSYQTLSNIPTRLIFEQLGILSEGAPNSAMQNSNYVSNLLTGTNGILRDLSNRLITPLMRNQQGLNALRNLDKMGYSLIRTMDDAWYVARESASRTRSLEGLKVSFRGLTNVANGLSSNRGFLGEVFESLEGANITARYSMNSFINGLGNASAVCTRTLGILKDNLRAVSSFVGAGAGTAWATIRTVVSSAMNLSCPIVVPTFILEIMAGVPIGTYSNDGDPFRGNMS